MSHIFLTDFLPKQRKSACLTTTVEQASKIIEGPQPGFQLAQLIQTLFLDGSTQGEDKYSSFGEENTVRNEN